MSSTAVHGWRTSGVICRRELRRFIRQPARIAAAIGTPLLLWALFAGGLADSVRGESLGDDSYSAFLLPGAMTLIAVFTAIFSSISIIEDRNEGWLQGALVSPVPRWSIALGKILGGSVVAIAQAAVLLAFAPMSGIELQLQSALLALVGLAATCIAMTALGVTFAWRSETSAAFHAVMNLVFMPMWLLSSAMFPIDGSAKWLAWLMTINPLTWCTQAIRNPLISPNEISLLPLAVAIGFAVLMVAIATATVSKPRT